MLLLCVAPVEIVDTLGQFREADPKYPTRVARTSQSFFIVFDSNAAALGRLTDAALRREFVATYLSLLVFSDVVNHYAEAVKIWVDIVIESTVLRLLR
jgi:hypothetical protein